MRAVGRTVASPSWNSCTNEHPGQEPLPDERRLGEDPQPPPPPPDPELDRRFSQLVREADVADVLDEKEVDGGLPALLRAPA